MLGLLTLILFTTLLTTPGTPQRFPVTDATPNDPKIIFIGDFSWISGGPFNLSRLSIYDGTFDNAC